MPRPRMQKPTQRRSASRATTGTTANLPSSHPRFGQQLDRNGVVFARSRVQPPSDADDLLEQLNRRRRSPSPSEREYRAYLDAVETSYNEDTMTRAFDSIAKVQRDRPVTSTDANSRRYVTVYNMQWTESNAPIQEGLSNPKPDVMEAFTTASYPSDALEALGGALAPSKHPPAMPSLVVHAKGPNGPMDEAEKQCAYDGAVMVQSAQQTHSYLAQPATTFDTQTQALTIAFNGEDLHIYANHHSVDGRFHCYPISTEKPRFSFSRYKTARRQLRNAQDWGRARAERTCNRLWQKSRRDAAILERRRIQRELEDEEDAKLIAGILTPPPSSDHCRKRSPRYLRASSCDPTPRTSTGRKLSFPSSSPPLCFDELDGEYSSPSPSLPPLSPRPASARLSSPPPWFSSTQSQRSRKSFSH